MGKSTRHIWVNADNEDSVPTWQLLVPNLLRTKPFSASFGVSLFRSGSNLSIPAYTTSAAEMIVTNFK